MNLKYKKDSIFPPLIKKIQGNNLMKIMDTEMILNLIKILKNI